MLYEKYQRKILKLAKFLKTVRRFRALIISVVAVIAVATGSFLATQGMVYDSVDSHIEITYGDPLN